MSQLSAYPPMEEPEPASNARAFVALILGILAMVAFFALALPADRMWIVPSLTS